MTTSGHERNLMGKQPARTLIIDVGSPFTGEVADDICDAMENVFSIACNFSGPARIPFFSIMILNNFQEVLLPLSYVRNNFPRIQAAVMELRNLLSQIGGRENPACFHQGLEEAGAQFSRQMHSTLQTGGLCQQLEIIILTSQKMTTVQRQVEAAVISLDMQHIRCVRVVSVYSEDLLTLDDLTVTGGSQTSSDLSIPPASGSSMMTSDLVEAVTLDHDGLSLQNFFSSWLVDTWTDSEHMHLILPPTEHEDEPLVIRCDLHERMLNPEQLPFLSQFTVHSDLSNMKTVFPSTSKAMGLLVPVYRLQVIALVPVTGVCDSVVFGLPMIALPTTCWKIDWDDLDKNQQAFRALCHSLIQKDQAMVAQLLATQPIRAPGHRHTSLPEAQPVGHFVLLPSTNGSLLIKSMAVQELMLPHNHGNQIEEPAEEYLAVINDSISQVETIENYNPLLYQGNLYNSLKNLGKKPQTQRQQKRPYENEATEKMTNKMVSSKQSRQTKKPSGPNHTPVQETSLADTPLSSRLLKKGFTKLPKRSLYSDPQDKFAGEPTVDCSPDNTCTAKSGRYHRVKPKLHFPTTL